MNEYNGIILIDKPDGWTSFDVVAKLRGILHMKKIGHAGTLDPMATGVLPVFLGKATRACDILPNDEKSYTAKFQLGVTTDTLDCTGKVLSTSDKRVNYKAVTSCAEKFVGDIMQIPPMYSAVKVNGQKLCNLARQGIVIERKPRPVHIKCIKITEFDEQSQSGEIYVNCTKGTYIRTVIDDIGQELGCGAMMTSLVRNSSAGFVLDRCHTIDDISQLENDGKMSEIILSVEEAFRSVYTDEIRLGERLTKLYKNGVKLETRQINIENSEDYRGKTLMVYGDGQEFLGLGYIDCENNQLRSLKNFY